MMSAARSGMLLCQLCGLVNARPRRPVSACACARCGSALHARKPYSIERTWAFLIAAYVLYIPANLLPVLQTGRLGKGAQWDTIMSGVIQLWHDRAYPLSIVILVASIGVPLAKLLSLTYLLVGIHLGVAGSRRGRTRLYRVLDFIGRWSMIDIFVGALLVGLVQFEPLAAIYPGPGAIAFGAVVVLTMLASQSFDPRLIWDIQAEAR
jgi:paraquat-inducible protein A